MSNLKDRRDKIRNIVRAGAEILFDETIKSPPEWLRRDDESDENLIKRMKKHNNIVDGKK